MVNHPNRNGVEAQLRRLVTRQPLDRIEISVRSGGVHMRALPTTFHPLVARRREREIASKGGSISLTEASAMLEKTMEPVATGNGGSMEEALAALQSALAQSKD